MQKTQKCVDLRRFCGLSLVLRGPQGVNHPYLCALYEAGDIMAPLKIAQPQKQMKVAHDKTNSDFACDFNHNKRAHAQYRTFTTKDGCPNNEIRV